MGRDWSPKPYPIRNPKSTQQQQGRVVNPPRGLKYAGRGEATLLPIDKYQRGTKGPSGITPVSDRGRGNNGR
jgi:hypothetical protein